MKQGQGKMTERLMRIVKSQTPVNAMKRMRQRKSEQKKKADPVPVRSKKKAEEGPEKMKREGRTGEKKQKNAKAKKPTSHAVPACSPVTLLPPFAFGVGVEEEKKGYEMRAYAHVER
jgi:hypothetical protein